MKKIKNIICMYEGFSNFLFENFNEKIKKNIYIMDIKKIL